MFNKKAAKKAKRRMSSDELNRLISERAYSYFEKRGFQQGNDLDDWLRAESEIKKELNLR
jgi:hypothetical protein